MCLVVPTPYPKESSQLRFTNDVLRASVELAKKARNDFWAELQASGSAGDRLRPLVAASVGPVGDNVAVWTGATDQSSAVHDVSDNVALQYYRRKLFSLCKAMPDLIALETLPSMREARIALQALSDVGPELAKHGLCTPPSWVAFICTTETSTAAGDDLAAAVAELTSSHHGKGAEPVAVGVNCTAPELMRPLLTRARAAAPEATLIAYPNSGELWDSRPESRCWHGGSEVLAAPHALDMRRAGADVVGGCCRVTPSQIAQFRAALLAA